MKWLTVTAARLAAGALFTVAFAIMLPALVRERVPWRMWGAAQLGNLKRWYGKGGRKEN